jgi:uncharacterized membrane protein
MKAPLIARVVAVVVLACASGCSSLGVKPWERDILAKETMQIGGDPVRAGFDKKVYFSREGSSGGSGFAGGGCGCN